MASTSWPERLPPAISTKNDAMTGTCRPPPSKNSWIAKSAGLEVERVEGCLAEQHVDPAVDEVLDLAVVRLAQLLPRRVPVGGPVSVHHDRGAPVQWPDASGYPARLAVFCDGVVHDPAADARAFQRHSVGPVFEAVVGLGDRRRGERVRLDQLRPGVDIRLVRLGDDLGLGQVEQVGVVFEIFVVVFEQLAPKVGFFEAALLEEDAVGAVDEEDSLGKMIEEGGGHNADIVP